jgi:hypothetical protein
MEKTFLTAEELQKLTELKNNYDLITAELGTLDIREFLTKTKLTEIQNHKTNFYNTLLSLQEQEKELGTTLTSKYGDGNINLETGEWSQ